MGNAGTGDHHHSSPAMAELKERAYRNFTIYYTDEPLDPAILVRNFLKAKTVAGKGRGGIKIFPIDDFRVVSRKYLHGGLLRALTRDVFLSGQRAIDEMEILLYLEEHGFPVVHPYAVLVERGLMPKNLFMITRYVEGGTDLLDFFKGSPRKERRRIVVRMAGLLRRLETLGVYHPDLHLNNVIVTPRGELIFLDFDKAKRKTVTAKDVENMFWRLNRYTEKWEQRGHIRITDLEKELFLRAYGRLSGRDMRATMYTKTRAKRRIGRIGWFIESLFYGGGK